MKKQGVALLLALVMCFSLTVNVWAEDIHACRLIHKGVSVTLTHYIEYEYNGKTYRSDETGGLTNYAAWSRMSDGDKRAVTKWFAGFNSQMDAQFSGAADMRAFAADSSGWKQAGEALRDRLAAAEFPELQAFYGSVDHGLPGAMLLTDEVRRQLQPEELERYDAAANAYNVLYQTGADAYQRLAHLKQYQVNAAVTAISSGLIDIIMKYAMPPQPGTVLDALQDELKGYVKDSLGIEDAIKDLAGLKKLTGEDKRIESEKAAKAIELYWNLMCLQQKLAEHCMRKCNEQISQLEELRASYGLVAETRAQEKAAAEARRQEEYETAVSAGVAQMDLDPDIDVAQEPGESPEDYNSRRLAAAKTWAAEEFTKADAGVFQLWAGGYAPNAIPADSDRYADQQRWNGCQSSDFYTGPFRDYLDIIGSESMSGGCEPMLLRSPEELFMNYSDLFDAEKYTGYASGIQAVYRGYDNALEALQGYEAEILACMAAREKAETDFRTGAQPYRNQAYNLTAAHCQYDDEGYGNWGVDDALWSSETGHGFEDEYRSLCDTLHQSTQALNDPLNTVRSEMAKVEKYKAEYRRLQETFEAGLQDRYDIYAYTQDDLDYGLSLAMQSIRKLDTLQAGYPDWLKHHKWMMVNPIAGSASICSSSTGVRDEELTSVFLSGVTTVAEEEKILLEQVLPVLEDYRSKELELLADLERAKGIIDAASQARITESGAVMGTAWELTNLNAMQLGGKTIQNHIRMMEDYGYYDYKYSLNGKVFPRETAVIPLLMDDIRGESPYMARIRALHTEILEKKGDLLRQAKAGTMRNGGTFDDHYYKNGCDVRYTRGIYGDAAYRSYLPYKVYNYWYENIKPIIEELDAVLYGNTTYTQVEKLTKPGDLTPKAPAGGSADATVQVGETATLRVTVEPANATYPDVVWRSDNDQVAAVDGNGTVTGLLPGTAVITATAVDSPSEARISASFTVVVKAGECAALEELGDGYYLLSPQVTRDGDKLAVTALVGTNGATDADTQLGAGNEFVNAAAVLAAYDSDRFLGCTVQTCIVYQGELSRLEAVIPLAAAPEGAPTVRLYLLQQADWLPAAGARPLAVGTAP